MLSGHLTLSLTGGTLWSVSCVVSLFLRADDELTGTDEFNREAGQFLLKEKVDILDEIDDGKN